MTIERVEPPHQGDEITTLQTFLDYFRDTIRIKTEGLDQTQLATALAPSDMTLGGLLKHLAGVELYWFVECLNGEEVSGPFASADWDADGDWDWHSAKDDSPEELRRLFDEAVAGSDRILARALAGDGLDTMSVKPSQRTKQPFSLRWIMVHLIEEYARHAGHADLIRQSIDGQVGD